MNRIFMRFPFYTGKRKKGLLCYKEGEEGTEILGFSDEELQRLASPEGSAEQQQQQQPAETEEQKAARLQQEEDKKKNPPAPPQETEEQKQARLANEQNSFLTPFNWIKEAYGVEVDTNDITAENAAQKLVQVIIDNYDLEEIIDPNLLKIQEYMAKNKVPFEAAIKQFAPAAEPTNDDEALAQYYQETLGLSEEDAKKEVENLSNKKIELIRAKQYLSHKKQESDRLSAERQQQQEVVEFNNHVEMVKRDVDTILAKFDNYEDIWGVKLSRAEKDAFKPVFKDLMIPKKLGEPALIHQLLDNDDLLLRVAYGLVNGSKITSELLSKPEEVRKLIEGKLLADPGIQTSGKKAEEVDDATFYQKFSEPETFISN